MKKILILIGIFFIVFGISIVVFQKINEPFGSEELVKDRDILLTGYSNKTIYIPEGKTVFVSVDLAYYHPPSLNITYPPSVNFYIFKEEDYEENRNEPLLQLLNQSIGGFIEHFHTLKSGNYIFVLEGYSSIDRYDIFYESSFSPFYIYMIGIIILLIGCSLAAYGYRKMKL